MATSCQMSQANTVSTVELTVEANTVSTVELTVESTIDSNANVILRLTTKSDKYHVLHDILDGYTC